ncbi:NAD(P)-dependent alcohol dehydrogenase [Pseudonocardia saturnea]
MHAASVNHRDRFVTSGRPYVMRAALGLRRPRVAVRGRDVAGRVETVGAAVTGFRTGDDVYAEVTTGSFAEYACVPERLLALKPTNLTFEQAAAVPVAAVTALPGPRDVGGVQPGQAVLINGASGGVGTFAVQIAKALGADVTGVCSTRSVELVRSLGADRVIDHTREDVARSGQRYDLIFDLAGRHPPSACRGALTRTGALVLASGNGGRVLGPLGRYVRALASSPFVAQRLRVHATTPSRVRPRRAHRAHRSWIGHARDRGDLRAGRHRPGHPPPRRATRPSRARHRRARTPCHAVTINGGDPT